MQVAMLGPLEVAGAQVRGARLRALAIRLALDADRVVTTGRLIDALWEDDPPGANALQALVSRLRRALPEFTVAAHPAGYRLVLDRDQVDVFRFERLAAEGRAAADPRQVAATLREALALWRGPALADVAEAEFAQAAIARLDELRLTAIQDRVTADLRLGVTEPVIAELEGLVVAHPLREPLTGLLMRALSASGQPGAALAVYQQTRVRLADELGAEPSATLADLHLAILRGEDGQAAGHRQHHDGPVIENNGDRDRPEGNLRAELTSFIGREDEVAEVAGLVGRHRLTTLTGPGGAGKTRLAVEAARTMTAMPDGVWLAELAPVGDPAELAPTILDALGLRERALLRGRPGSHEAPADPLGRLLAALSGKRALLVLDNCEHLVDAAAALAHRVLGACPQVRIMTTSREPLNITGEVLWPVRPLELPPELAPELSPESADPAVIGGCASVRLLEQRARAVSPGFAVTAGNAVAISRICRALDGMPLAIELAAARLRTMAPEHLATRLDDRFALLTGGSRTALPRHRTLRAVVDWSWDLLGADERAVWRRFSVFAGGATLEAAERVCGASLDLLTALVDKSLLTVRHDGGRPRYRMLEIIRAYGRERLAEAGEAGQVRAAHAACFLDLAGQAEPHLISADQLTWLRRLSDDQDNLHAAVRGAVAAGDAAAAVGLAGRLGWYWWLRGHKAEGTELISEALATPGPADDEPRALACAMGALLAIDLEETSRARTWFGEAARLTAGIPRPGSRVLRLVGPLQAGFEMIEAGRDPVSSGVLDEAAASDPDPWLRAIARLLRGHGALNFGRQHAEAEADFQTAVDLCRELGERWGTAYALMSLGTLATWRGEFEASVALRTEALGLAAELGTPEDVTNFRIQLARELWLSGDRDRAAAELARAVREADRIGLPDLRAMAALVGGDLARLDGDRDRAAAELGRAAELGARPGIAPQFVALSGTALGLLAAAEGDLDQARTRYAGALAVARPTHDAPVIAHVVVGLADLALREGDPARAAGLLGASDGIRGTRDESIADIARIAAAARAELGQDRYAEAFGRGQAAGMDEITSCA